MGAQRLDRVIVAGKLGFRQRGVDFVVAYLVEQHGRPALAAAQFRNKVMKALRGIRRDCPEAEGTYRVAHERE